MDDQIRMGGFSILPPGVKNLLIINTLLFFATLVFHSTGLCDLDKWLGLHYFSASHFYPWQFVTYMFMHANFEHLFFNMFALWMFGAMVENHWGTKRFLLYYFITGVGAGLCHYLVIFFQLHPMIAVFNQFLDNPSMETYRYLVENNPNVQFNDMLRNNLLVLQQSPKSLPELVDVTYNALDGYLNSINIVGASGAVYGLLLAFGMLFPNSYIYIYFLLPIKAKWFVLIYGGIELVSGIFGTADGVAHFAHLGGMLFGLLLILLWRRAERQHQNTYYPNFNDYDDQGGGFFSRMEERLKRKKKEKYYVSTESGRPLSDEEYNARKVAEKQRIDEILDKISAKGYDALSKEEKDFLFHYSRK